MKLKEKWNLLSKKNKLTVGIVCLACIVVLAGIGGTVYAQNQNQKRQAERQEKVDNATSVLTSLEKETSKLFDSEDSSYLAKDVTTDNIETLQSKYDKEIKSENNNGLVAKDFSNEYKSVKKAVSENLERAEMLLKAQSSINTLFKQEDSKVAINGKEITNDLPIVDDLKQEVVDSAETNYFKKDTTNAFEKTINDLLDNAEGQLKQVSTAKEAVEKVYKDGNVISTDTALYDTAKAETEKIKNEKAKKELTDQLDKVKADSDKKAEEESEKQKSDSQSTETNNANQGSQNANNNSATGTNGGTTSNNNGYSASGGSTASGGNSTGTGGGNAGGSSGGSTGGGTTIPAGWIVPPYPIGSDDLWNWLIDNGYSGFDSSDGYIRPY